MNSIAILGAGGHTRSSINLLRSNYADHTYAIFDDSFDSKNPETINDIDLRGKPADIKDNEKIFLSIGDNKKRAEYFNIYNNRIIKKNLFHKTSFIENNVKIGLSNQIFANAYINSNVKIGSNNIINSGSLIEHESIIGDHNHISVSSVVCGRVKIGNFCMIGANSTIIDKISICDNVIIGAGSVVVKDITVPGTYAGNPARKIK